METTKTKAEQFCEIASWLKKQDEEFKKNFVSMNSIIRVWKAIPEDGKDRKIQPWLKKLRNKQTAGNVKLAINAEFGFRYFEDAPKRYYVYLRYEEWTMRGKLHKEVRLSTYDRYKEREWGGDALIEIKDKTHAKSAAERLIKDNTEEFKHDMEIEYSDGLQKLIEKSIPTDKEFQVLHTIPGL